MKRIKAFMNRRGIYVVITAAGLILLSAMAFRTPRCNIAATPPQTADSNSFAVLELFTSEGCSSCPAADKLLARVQKEAGKQPVYVLAYHVDYWNRLGWKDAFSDAQYSERQYRYSRSLGSQVYTPQVVINGRSECVGADEAALTESIHNALNSTGAKKLIVRAQTIAGKAAIHYLIKGNIEQEQLMIAIVQKQAVSKVMRGENEGRTLTHAQIVRRLYTHDLRTTEGAEHISLPDGFNMREWEIIAMVQSTKTGIITAATRATFR